MVRDKPAQGNALGSGYQTSKALKGRPHLVTPFQGCVFLLQTQGVALGWLVSGRWPAVGACLGFADRDWVRRDTL